MPRSHRRAHTYQLRPDITEYLAPIETLSPRSIARQLVDRQQAPRISPLVAPGDFGQNVIISPALRHLAVSDGTTQARKSLYPASFMTPAREFRASRTSL